MTFMRRDVLVATGAWMASNVMFLAMQNAHSLINSAMSPKRTGKCCCNWSYLKPAEVGSTRPALCESLTIRPSNMAGNPA
jgi:hypothetical protein